MSNQIVQRIEACHCGHDKATHFWDMKGSGDCLGMRCDCAGYVDRHEPGTYRKQRKWVDANGPITDRMWDIR